MISTEEMRKLEDKAEKKGVSKKQLMENAGKGFYEEIKDSVHGSVAIFCGPGNNGGDGFVIAKHLAEDVEVDVLLLGEPKSKIAKKAFENIQPHVEILKHINQLGRYNLVIDAMLGTGVKGEIREPIRSAIVKYNTMRCKKISVDVPTGINPDTGEKSSLWCEFDEIITFHDLKKGLEEHEKKTNIVDIGIPE